MRGAMEVYLNGRKVQQIGKVGESIDKEISKYTELHLLSLPLDSTNQYTLLIDYSNHQSNNLNLFSTWTWSGFYNGFELEYLGRGQKVEEDFRQSTVNLVIVHFTIAVLILTIALSHLFTFIFVRSRGIHLWFGLFLVTIAFTSSLSIYSDVGRANLPIHLKDMLMIEWAILPLAYLMDLASIRCLHYFFYRRPPKIWYVFIISALFTYCYVIFLADLPAASLIRTLFHSLSILEVFRVAIVGFIRQQNNNLLAQQNVYIIIIGAVLAAILEGLGVWLNTVYGWNVFSSSILFFIANATILSIVVAMQLFILRVEGKRMKKVQEALVEAQKREQSLAVKEAERNVKLDYERQRIARDLHDNIGSHLTFLLQKIEGLPQQTQLSLADNEAMEALARTTIQELRNTIWTMKKEKVSLQDLENKIYDFVWQIGELPNMQIICQLDETNAEQLQLSSQTAINCFRILQEALQNAVKYSEAKEVTVKLEILNPENIKFLVSDNGKGFDRQEVEVRQENYGLINMQARAQILGVNLGIESQIDQGTKVSFVLELTTNN